LDSDKAAGVARVVSQLVKEPGTPVAPVEIKVRREGLRRLVEDVKRPVQVVDEVPAASRLL